MQDLAGLLKAVVNQGVEDIQNCRSKYHISTSTTEGEILLCRASQVYSETLYVTKVLENLQGGTRV